MSYFNSAYFSALHLYGASPSDSQSGARLLTPPSSEGGGQYDDYIQLGDPRIKLDANHDEALLLILALIA